MPNPIPQHWTRTRIGDAFDVQLGKMLSAEAKQGREKRPYLANRNVQWNKVRVDDVNFMHFSERELQRYRLMVNDILVCEGGEIGRTAIWNGELSECYIQNSIHRLRPSGNKIDPRFLLHYMKFAADRQVFNRVSGQTSIAHLTKENLINVEVAHPNSLEEQQKIGSILDALDERIVNTEKTIEKLLVIRHAILSSSVLESSNPQVRLRNIASVSSGSTPSRDRSDYWNSGTIPWVKTGEVNFSEIRETEEYVTDIAVRDSRLKIYLPGTILVAMYGEGITRGRSAILRVPATVNQACAAIVLHDRNIMPEYLAEELRYRYGEIRDMSQGSHQSNLNAGHLADLKIRCPSRPDQARIVKTAQYFDRKFKIRKAEVSKLEKLKEGLMADLLTGQVRVSSI